MIRGGVAIALATIALAAASPAPAAPAPDAPRLEALEAACDSAWRVRIVSRRATYLMRRPELGIEGVNVVPRPSGPPALFTIGEPKVETKWIPWAEIERLDTAEDVSARGALYGLLSGAAAGGLIVASVGPDLSDTDDNVVAIFAVGLTLTGGVAGYLFAQANPRLTPLYP